MFVPANEPVALDQDGAVAWAQVTAVRIVFDVFARDWLIQPSDARRLEVLGQSGQISRAAVSRFAAEVGVAPGIVVGRMQKEGWLAWTHLNGLKVRYEWGAVPKPEGARP